MSEQANLNAHKERIKRVVTYIHANLDTPLDMETLGNVACLSSHHWHRIYREIMGETASQTIRRRRLWRAAHQLLQTSNTIEQIAVAAHYGSTAAFSRAFTNQYTCSPSRYRDKGRKGSMTKIEKRLIEPIKLIGMDHQGPHYEIGRTFDRLFAWACTTEGMITPETKGIAVFFDNPTEKPPEELTSLAAIPCPEGKEPGEGTRAHTIPGGPHAIARHIGPYTELGKTYTQLFESWLPASGEVRNGAPLFEINMNDPKTTPPTDLITDIYVPLK
ncbi:MAG: AraC family transcriptional regulator [Rhodobiaceae bacterium]|nr:AraC family transcriptional regulator [Rhodobiaceae bacterium]